MPKWHTAFGWLVQPISEAISEASSGRVSIRSGVELCPSRAQMHGVSRGTPGAASKESWEPSIWGSSPSNKARDGSLLGKYAMNPIVFINMYIYIYINIPTVYDGIQLIQCWFNSYHYIILHSNIWLLYDSYDILGLHPNIRTFDVYTSMIFPVRFHYITILSPSPWRRAVRNIGPSSQRWWRDCGNCVTSK